MPIHKTAGGGHQWGSHGKIYYGKSGRKRAAMQAAAARMSGYKGK